MQSNIFNLGEKLRQTAHDPRTIRRIKAAVILELGADRTDYPARLGIEAISAACLIVDGGGTFEAAITAGRCVLAELRIEHDRRLTALLNLVSKRAWDQRTGLVPRVHYHYAMLRARKVIDLGGAIGDVIDAALNPHLRAD